MKHFYHYGLFAFFAVGLAACGGGDKGNNFQPLDSMRNDCNMGVGRLIALNGFPFNQFKGSAVSNYKLKTDATYGWYPLALFSSTNSADYSFSKATTGPGKDERCEMLADLFVGASKGTGAEKLHSELSLDFTFPDFAFPESPDGIGADTASLDLAPSLNLVITFVKATTPPTTVKSQTIPAQVRCATPFVAHRSWNAETGGGQGPGEDKFCKADGSGKRCLQFIADFGDKCELRITGGAFTSLEGKPFKATLGGKFSKSTLSGYDFSVSGWELD